jgi:hypothetical protein
MNTGQLTGFELTLRSNRGDVYLIRSLKNRVCPEWHYGFSPRRAGDQMVRLLTRPSAAFFPANR